MPTSATNVNLRFAEKLTANTSSWWLGWTIVLTYALCPSQTKCFLCLNPRRAYAQHCNKREIQYWTQRIEKFWLCSSLFWRMGWIIFMYRAENKVLATTNARINRSSPPSHPITISALVTVKNKRGKTGSLYCDPRSNLQSVSVVFRYYIFNCVTSV